jgi:hypothetical protein
LTVHGEQNSFLFPNIFCTAWEMTLSYVRKTSL